MENLRKHLRHGKFNKQNFSILLTRAIKINVNLIVEIWKNTAVMSPHLISLLLQYRFTSNTSAQTCAQSVTEFVRDWRSSVDFAFIGESDRVTEYGLKVFCAKKNISPSVAMDLLKHESIMSIINLTTLVICF